MAAAVAPTSVAAVSAGTPGGTTEGLLRVNTRSIVNVMCHLPHRESTQYAGVRAAVRRRSTDSLLMFLVIHRSVAHGQPSSARVYRRVREAVRSLVTGALLVRDAGTSRAVVEYANERVRDMFYLLAIVLMLTQVPDGGGGGGDSCEETVRRARDSQAVYSVLTPSQRSVVETDLARRLLHASVYRMGGGSLRRLCVRTDTPERGPVLPTK